MIKPKVVRSELQEGKQQKLYYDKHAKDLTTLQPGQTIRVQIGKQWKPAVVTSASSEPRSYNVKTPDGRNYRRNRRHIMSSKLTRCEQSSFDDNWPGCESTVNEHPSLPEHDSEAPEQNSNNDPSSESVSESGPTLRRSQRNTQRPARYAETWACK